MLYPVALFSQTLATVAPKQELEKAVIDAMSLHLNHERKGGKIFYFTTAVQSVS